MYSSCFAELTKHVDSVLSESNVAWKFIGRFPPLVLSPIYARLFSKRYSLLGEELHVMGPVFSISQLPLIPSALLFVALQSAAEKWTTSSHTGSSKMTFFREDLYALFPHHGE